MILECEFSLARARIASFRGEQMTHVFRISKVAAPRGEIDRLYLSM
jgi:hypothetical protein